MEAAKIKDVIAYLESLAPTAYQEAYDNSGLLTGDLNAKISGIIVTLDCTEAVVEEAIQSNCNLIIAHHPILFKGLKKITGRTYVERTLIKAIKNDIALYAMHTNMDNIHTGVNKKIAERIGLENTRVLLPKRGILSKLVTFVPKAHVENVTRALHAEGAGQIGNYKNCSFEVSGIGKFEPNEKASPFIGKSGVSEKVEEDRIEMVFASHLEKQILRALKKSHPYEEVAFYVTKIENEDQDVGSGLIGELAEASEPIAFLNRLKKQMNVSMLRHTAPDRPVKKVAVCGGAGSFLLDEAIRQGADTFISSDFKYHEFFDAEGKIMIADIGHYESEQFTKELFREVLSKKFTTFAINFSNTVTNPISYL